MYELAVLHSSRQGSSMTDHPRLLVAQEQLLFLLRVDWHSQ